MEAQTRPPFRLLPYPLGLSTLCRNSPQFPATGEEQLTPVTRPLNPDEGSSSCVRPPQQLPDLSTSNVRVTPAFNGIVPTRIQVDIVNYRIDTFFTQFPLSGKPRCTFDYMGRFIVP